MAAFKARHIFARGLHGSDKVLNKFQIKLTKDVYKVKRGNYAVLNDSHLQTFENILSRERVLTDEEDVQSYNVDWVKMVRGTDECYKVLVVYQEHLRANPVDQKYSF